MPRSATHLGTLLLILSGIVAEAQSFYAIKRERDLIATFGLNSSTYYGDLKDPSDILDFRPSLSLGALYYFDQRFGVRAEFSYINLQGADSETGDSGKIPRNLSFTSNSFEFAVSGVVNLVPNGQRFYQRSNFNAYGFAGVGLLYFNPKAELNGEKYALQPLKTEGVSYSRLALVIPYGVGGRYKVNPFFNVAVELGWRKTFTDYIDDVSDKYVDNASFTDPIAQQLADRGPEIGYAIRTPGTKRGDPSKKDAYMLLSVKVEYYLPHQFRIGQNKLYSKKRKQFRRRSRR